MNTQITLYTHSQKCTTLHSIALNTTYSPAIPYSANKFCQATPKTTTFHSCRVVVAPIIVVVDVSLNAVCTGCVYMFGVGLRVVVASIKRWVWTKTCIHYTSQIFTGKSFAMAKHIWWYTITYSFHFLCGTEAERLANYMHPGLAEPLHGMTMMKQHNYVNVFLQFTRCA